MQGTCISPDTCDCSAGWTGSDCDTGTSCLYEPCIIYCITQPFVHNVYKVHVHLLIRAHVMMVGMGHSVIHVSKFKFI